MKKIILIPFLFSLTSNLSFAASQIDDDPVIVNNNNANGQRQATNNEIMDVLQRLVRKSNSLETELHNVRTEINNVKIEITEIKAEMQDMKDELKRDMRDLKDELKQRQDDFEKKIEDRIEKFEQANNSKTIAKEFKEELGTTKLLIVGAAVVAYGVYQVYQNAKDTEKKKEISDNYLGPYTNTPPHYKTIDIG